MVIAALLLGMGGVLVLLAALMYLGWPRSRLSRERAEENRQLGWPVDVRTFGWRLVPIGLALLAAAGSVYFIRIRPRAHTAEAPVVVPVGAPSQQAIADSLHAALVRGEAAPLEAVIAGAGPLAFAVRSEMRADLARGAYSDVEVHPFTPLGNRPDELRYRVVVDRRRGAFRADGVAYSLTLVLQDGRYFIADTTLFRDTTWTLVVLAACALLFPVLLIISIVNRRTTRLLHLAEAEIGELQQVALRLLYRGPLRGRRGVLALGDDRLLWLSGWKRRYAFELKDMSQISEFVQRSRTGRVRRGFRFQHAGQQHTFIVRKAAAWLSALRQAVPAVVEPSSDGPESAP